MKEFWNYNNKIGIERNIGNTNTDNNLSKIILNFLDISIRDEMKILEPAVGSGSFYFAVLDKLKDHFSIDHIVENILYAYDIDADSLTILKNRLIEDYHYQPNENTKVFLQDFLLTEDNQRFDYVITNPPYISHKNIERRDQYLNLEIATNISKVSDIYIYFYIKCLNQLKNNGKLLFLCSDSWIDSKFGEVLKSYLTSEAFNLDFLINSQLYPFFRDDTNAIITIISKSKKNTTQLYHYRNKIDQDPSHVSTITKAELKNLFFDNSILNKRNALVLFFDYYKSLKNFFNSEHFVNLKDRFEVITTSETFSKLLSKKTNFGGGVAIFWLPQARVNRKPNYKNYVRKEELPYCTLSDNPKNLKPNGGIYLSNVIDRFPLVFNVDYATYHISKYFYLRDKNQNLDPNLENEEQARLNHILLHNIFTFLNMELELKEGTRKTLRKGECGLAKEISKQDLMEIKIPNLSGFAEIKDDIIQYSSKVIYNIEEALKDKNYINIQLYLAKKMNLSKEQTLDIIKKLLFLYLLRMRHIEKITNFDEYFAKNYSSIVD